MTTPAPKHWTLDDLPWTQLDASKVSSDLLKVIKTAAMVERNGADYGRYLCNVFRDDPEFCDTALRWAAEEEQHGEALGRWAERVDPTFKFDDAFRRFTDMYRISVDAQESIRGSLVGELCARCVVETGTSSFYSALRDAVDEPVLKKICGNIAADEFRHYRVFFDAMEKYISRDGAGLSKWERIKVALTRFREADDDELASAYHAGNGVAGPYQRDAANTEYTERALGFYQQRHVRRAAHMFAQAAGVKPDGWFGKLLGRVMWAVIAFRGRKFRPLLASAA